MTKKLTKKEIEEIKKSHSHEEDVYTEEESKELEETLKKIETNKINKSEEEDEF